MLLAVQRNSEFSAFSDLLCDLGLSDVLGLVELASP